MTDRELERLLAATAAATRYPPTPALSARVLARLGEGRVAWPALRPALRPAALLAALAVVALVLLAVALAVGSSREAIADFFGVEGSTVERLPAPTAATNRSLVVIPTPTPTATPIPVLPASLDELAELIGFAPALPEVEEAVAPAYVRYGEDEVVAVLRYERFDLWQARLEQDAGFGKGLPPEGATLEDVLVGEWPARWISGGPHIVYYIHSYGASISASTRVVERNTLVWRTDYAFYRIETDLSLDQALAIAETLP